MFSDIKSIDFQPRYNEKGRLFGFSLSFCIMIRFVTFTSEIGYNECLQLGTYTFGDDELRIEPGQDKGTMPTSVSHSPSPLFPDHPRFKECTSDRIRCAIPRLDRISFFCSHSQKKQAISPLSFTFISTKPHSKAREFSGTVFIQYRNIEDAGIVRFFPRFHPGLGLSQRRAVRRRQAGSGVQEKAG